VNEVAAYLQERFLRADEFATRCGSSHDELSRLIALRLAPAPAYRVDATGTMHSHVFGAMAANAPQGEWFNPDAVNWVVHARDALAACDQDATRANERLRCGFRERYLQALRASHAADGPVPGFGDDAGNFDEPAFDAQFPDIWAHFLAGTYGLCVAVPSDEARIVAKETAQARLTHLTANGTRRDFDEDGKAAVRELIARYQVLSMPFSPIEYPRSSRKRLVEDMLPHVTPGSGS
jgi:hypothetical protein